MKTATIATPLQALELPSSRRWLEALNDWYRQASLRAMANDAATAQWPTTAEARAQGAAARAKFLR